MFFERIIEAILWSRPVRRLRQKLIPPYERQPWTGDMVLENCGCGKWVKHPGHSCASTRLRWVSREKDADGKPIAVRVPQESTESFPSDGPFTAAGKRYTDIRQLYARMDETGTWCRDKYGRELLYIRERFPCFDSFDAMDEHRFYRWFFLREGQRLTRIYYADESWEIQVTEDVENLEDGCWEQMLELDYFDQGKEERE